MLEPLAAEPAGAPEPAGNPVPARVTSGVVVAAGLEVPGVVTTPAETPFAVLTGALLTLLDVVEATSPEGRPDAFPMEVPVPPLAVVPLPDGTPVETLVTVEGSFMLPVLLLAAPFNGNPVALLTLAPAATPEAFPTDDVVVAVPDSGAAVVEMLLPELVGNPVALPIAPAPTFVVPVAEAAVPVTGAPELAAPVVVPDAPAPFAMAGTARASKSAPQMKGDFSMSLYLNVAEKFGFPTSKFYRIRHN